MTRESGGAKGERAKGVVSSSARHALTQAESAGFGLCSPDPKPEVPSAFFWFISSFPFV